MIEFKVKIVEDNVKSLVRLKDGTSLQEMSLALAELELIKVKLLKNILKESERLHREGEMEDDQ